MDLPQAPIVQCLFKGRPIKSEHDGGPSSAVLAAGHPTPAALAAGYPTLAALAAGGPPPAALAAEGPTSAKGLKLDEAEIQLRQEPLQQVPLQAQVGANRDEDPVASDSIPRGDLPRHLRCLRE